VSIWKGWLFLLIVSVREVFQTMLATKVAPVFEPAQRLHLEWTAMVGLAGELRGVLRLGCDEKPAVRITSKMLRGPLPGPDEQTADALGEVCNRIAGSYNHKVYDDLANVARSAHPALSPGKTIASTGKNLNRCIR
jgi:chemotaxis protein CheX